MNRRDVLELPPPKQPRQTQPKEITLFQAIRSIADVTYKLKIVRKHESYEVRGLALMDGSEEFLILELSEAVGNVLME